MPQAIAFDPRATVKEVLERYPSTVTVFRQFGIHMCCGSDASLAEAAHRDGVDPDALIEAIRLSTLVGPVPGPAA